MKAFALLLVLLASTIQSHARLGESLQQCEQRYGSVLFKKEDGAHGFFKDGIYVFAIFDQNNVCSLISYIRKDKAAFSPDELSKLLTSNSLDGRRKWSRQSETLWTSDDGFVASLKPNGVFMFGTVSPGNNTSLKGF